ncbi:MAG TPA: hypothetical protein VHE35_30630 [Kofleriaceae bacterium]|nr:hypothetical protein [Kofleriaceae bacterium]
MRHVKGVLFLDYVRMLRSHKGIDWTRHLPREDHPWLEERVDPRGWYPMASFERFGELILRFVARNDLQAVRMWGRLSVDLLRSLQPALVEPGDPIETLNRFRVLRGTYFDFEALEVPMLHDGEASIIIRYHMRRVAEEAASVQTMGFFERLLETSGAHDVEAEFASRAWVEDTATLLRLRWTV